MPDDRFADLGTGTRAGERLAELDERQPEPRKEPPRRPGRYTWVVGVAFVILIAVVSINTFGNENAGSSGPAAGRPLPRFAAPSVIGGPDADPNIKQSAGDGSVPNDTPACEVRVAGALRSCDYTSKPLVITFIVPTGECAAYLDRVDRLRSEFPKVNFLAVISSPKGRAESMVRAHSWRQPVALDRNGAILSRFHAPPFCATSVFAYRGGIVRSTKIDAQKWADARLRAVIRAMEAR
jgi:hypothetical protein